MDTFLEIVKYTIPSLIVFITAYFIIRSFITNDREKRKHELYLGNQKIITPIRLQAYERMILLLERISPESLIMRINRPGLTAKQLQTELHNSIRAEFEHNLSQQVYMSIKAWEVVKSAKANLIKLINTAADNIKPDAEAIKLGKAILEMEMELEKSPTRMAIDFLKQEVNKYI